MSDVPPREDEEAREEARIYHLAGKWARDHANYTAAKTYFLTVRAKARKEKDPPPFHAVKLATQILLDRVFQEYGSQEPKLD